MRVAVLGLGRMGRPIADRILAAGHDLSVWNRTEASSDAFVEREARSLERKVRVLERPADAFAHADLAITMLADGTAVEAVTLGDNGVLGGGEQLPARESSGRPTLVDMSTISATTSAHVAAECDRRGVAFLRAPVTGNPSVVAAGNLGIIVSGPRADVERVAGTLRDIGPNLFYVGESEEARIVKLAINLMIAGTAQLIAEALVLGEVNGIERGRMLEVMGASAIGSPFVKYKTDALIADDYESTFTARLADKDLALALEAGRQAPLPVTALTRELVEDCIERGMGDLDFMALLPRLRLEADL